MPADQNHFPGGQRPAEPEDTQLPLIHKILELEALHDFGVSVSSVLDVSSLTDKVLTRLLMLLDSKTGFVCLKADESDALQISACSEINLATVTQHFINHPLVAEVLASGEGAIEHDLDCSSYQQLLIVPIKSKENVLGIVGILDKEDGVFNQEDMRLISAFSGCAACALVNARLHTRLQDSNRELGSTINELQSTHGQIIQQERLQALGQMAGGIVHDVNNALSAVLGYTELWITFPDMLDKKDNILYDLKTINMAAKDATHIVRRLRGFYRPCEEGNVMVTVKLNEVVTQAIDITHPKWSRLASEKGFTVEVGSDLEDIPTISGDESDLREMFVNLIFNAVDAMTETGTITLRTRHSASGPSTGVGCVILEVCDTGSGMTEEVRQKCLEPFFSTKGEQGTGMGLAMVFGIIQRHQGILEIDSTPGEGTTFRIQFPILDAESAVDVKSQQQGLPHPLHILVVEDDAIQRELLIRYLKEDGHTAVQAGTGREGLEAFHRGQFDLIITDMTMPEMNGLHLARTIRKIAPQKPIIIISGDDMGEELSEDDVPDHLIALQKPLILQVFRQALKQAMDTALL
ncbi:MAG: response regulator [Candidatus Latescibacteria bacterium]|jgi:signal transduction histidine kinase|nr:response regulator [Candidatus Latescibacterota bacterium]MDP7238151.1 response regulator [Candidatus Latescibacterota bacterium]